MNLRKITKGSSLLMIVAVVLSTSVVATAFGALSSSVFTSEEDFHSLYGLELNTYDSGDSWQYDHPNFDSLGENTNTIDTTYDQGLYVQDVGFEGWYTICVNIVSSQDQDIQVNDVNWISCSVLTYEDIQIQLTSNNGQLTGTVPLALNIQENQVDDWIFDINVATVANDYQIEFYAVEGVV
jgi:hypothetical protein